MSRRMLLAALAAMFLFAGLVPAAGAFPAVKTGVEFGLLGSQPWLGELPAGSSFDQKPSVGFAGGLTFDFGLPHGLELASGLRYFGDRDRRDVNFTIDFGGGDTSHLEGKTTIEFHRIGLPLRLRTGLPDAHGITIEAGLEPTYLVKAVATDDVTVTTIVTNAPRASRAPARPAATIFESFQNPDGDVTDQYQRWSLMAGGGLGWKFGLLGKDLALRARWHQGLLDEGKSKDLKVYTRTGELALGLSW